MGLNDLCKKVATRDHIAGQKANICCSQETKMPVITQADVRVICGDKLSSFVFKPSRGASGGILLCWDDRERFMIDWRMGNYSISVLFEDRATSWRWICSSVYGPCEDEDKGGLWEELSSVKRDWGLPWCILGDFNVTRFVEDRNQPGPISPAIWRSSLHGLHRKSYWICRSLIWGLHGATYGRSLLSLS
ncbi:hypothetical protein QJS10_CPB11g01479 [Acorus calamus]|uniref:Endonuclease/exonuclease/phosphatase n=1 Tax=Acorus calamus TaxID=4465 RepID=A0AAV9DVJ4_ACOCL|nr:hypothetical protein QJS10_CPB11g01479 [Acorus calamus]